MTKLIASALAALALTAGAAFAQNTFSLDRARSTADALSLVNVQADRAGRISVYAHDGDSPSGIGRLLGQAKIEAGATGDVDVALTGAADERLVVVMMNANHSVAKLTTRAIEAN
jgi:hypothetical protein